jgi:hypothetical protein
MTKIRAEARRPPMLADRAHQQRTIAAATAESEEERRLDEAERDQRA